MTATASKTTWCRACGGSGDFDDGITGSHTCGVCGGLGEHPVDVTPYGVIGDGVEASYTPPKPRPERKQIPEPDEYSLAILRGLQHKPMYGGTVPNAEVQRRRARNRVASASRRINRGRR